MSDTDPNDLGEPLIDMTVRAGRIRWWNGPGVLHVESAHDASKHWQANVTEMVGGNLEILPGQHRGYLGLIWIVPASALGIVPARARRGIIDIDRDEFEPVSHVWALIDTAMRRSGITTRAMTRQW